MDPELLIILFLILAPLLERLFKAGQKKPPEPPNREIPRREPPRHMPAPRSDVERADASVQQPTARRVEESAATVLPDELWEILTGERRMPQRVPVPEPADDELYDESYDESYDEMEPTDEWANDDTAALEPVPPPREVIRRREPVRAREGLHTAPSYQAPDVVSLEPLVVDDVERHKQFHDRVTALTAAAPKQAAIARFRFASDEDMRRAIIITEILGRPKGLE